MQYYRINSFFYIIRFSVFSNYIYWPDKKLLINNGKQLRYFKKKKYI